MISTNKEQTIRKFENSDIVFYRCNDKIGIYKLKIVKIERNCEIILRKFVEYERCYMLVTIFITSHNSHLKKICS